jgi:hypothetical protein
MTSSPLALLAGLMLLASAPAWPAESHLVIVVNPDSGVSRITWDEARNLFLGRQKRLSSGLPAVTVEQDDPPGIRSRFYLMIAHKDLSEINAYWARLYFTGQAHPPKQAGTADEVIRRVAADRGAIGLLEWAKVDHRVRVVLALDGP